MSGRLSRDRQRRDNPRQSTSTSPFQKRGKNPPSRHLWVGNIGHGIEESMLADLFGRYGEVESVAVRRERGYGFVNFKREDDAIAALDSLQGFSLAPGLPLKIEFSKSDKSSASRDENYYQQRDELQPPTRRSAISPRDSRKRHASPDAFCPDSSRASDDSTEHPSEMLWIGFPSFLRVDEAILRKAFSPFGEIDKITVFQGRPYAFVQFRSLASACRAKETLQGKLFGNPRVHICFARNDHASSTGGRRGVGHNVSSSPHFEPNGQAGSPDSFRVSRNSGTMSDDPGTGPPYFSNMEYENPDVRNLHSKEPSWRHTNDTTDNRRFIEGWPQRQLHHRSPVRDESVQFHTFSPRKQPKESLFPENAWDNPEDSYFYHEAKKLKSGSFSHVELPEMHHSELGAHIFRKTVPDFPLSDEGRLTLPYRRLPEHRSYLNPQVTDRLDNWQPSHDSFLSSTTFSSKSIEPKRSTQELLRPGMKEVWKWEGTIAKGGTPVCRARCFPVGKFMDIFLPDFLDCTARTSLDMLAKHYYQSTNSWVVFFVAASDADMGYYNEFMHYLGEKQRAAVVKLDERNTLFLVPPSDFSENVLKVPGKLSISGVVLSLEPSSPSIASLPPVNETMYSHVGAPLQKLESPLGSYSSSASYRNPNTPEMSVMSQGSVTTSDQSLLTSYAHGRRQESLLSHPGNTAGSTWPLHPLEGTAPISKNFAVHSFPVSESYHHSVSGTADTGPSARSYDGGGMSYSGSNNLCFQELKPSVSEPFPLGGLQTEQQGQPAPPVLLPQSLNSSSRSAEVFRQTVNAGNQPENQATAFSGHTALQMNQMPSTNSTSQSNQLQQPLQAEVMQSFSNSVGIGNAQNESETEKRLQATLKLAAALLQQIQQGKGP